MENDNPFVWDEDIYNVERQRAVLERVAQELVRRRLTAPAVFLLESIMPLTFIAAQALIVLRPLVQMLIGIKDYEVFAAALEKRENVEWLLQRLEEAETAPCAAPQQDKHE